MPSIAFALRETPLRPESYTSQQVNLVSVCCGLLRIWGYTTMNLGQLENGTKAAQRDAVRIHKLEEVLSAVYELLESYAPFWYSEGLRDRVRSALELDDTPSS